MKSLLHHALHTPPPALHCPSWPSFALVYHTRQLHGQGPIRVSLSCLTCRHNLLFAPVPHPSLPLPSHHSSFVHITSLHPLHLPLSCFQDIINSIVLPSPYFPWLNVCYRVVKCSFIYSFLPLLFPLFLLFTILLSIHLCSLIFFSFPFSYSCHRMNT